MDRLEYDDGAFRPYTWVERAAGYGSVVIPVLPGGEIVLVDVYRPPVESWSLELPGGLAEPGESPVATARRELLEETGLDAGRLVPVGQFLPDPGVQSLRVFAFRAENCSGWQDGRSERDDSIRAVRRLAPAMLIRSIESGEITAGVTLSTLLLGGYSLPVA